MAGLKKLKDTSTDAEVFLMLSGWVPVEMPDQSVAWDHHLMGEGSPVPEAEALALNKQMLAKYDAEKGR